jgi:hypothetical protein
VSSYLLHAKHSVAIAGDRRPSAQSVADWLERTLGSEAVRVERVGETVVEFRSRFKLFDVEPYNDSLAFVARGEVEVEDAPDGPRIVVRANPHIWLSLIPIAQLVVLFGWTNASALLRWGAGLGGIVLGGIFLFLTWGHLNTFLATKVANLHMLRARPQDTLPTVDDGAA